jgi:hypothetical protein
MTKPDAAFLPRPFSVPEQPPHDPKQLREWLTARGDATAVGALAVVANIE